jgi:hypothetical protein
MHGGPGGADLRCLPFLLFSLHLDVSPPDPTTVGSFSPREGVQRSSSVVIAAAAPAPPPIDPCSASHPPFSLGGATAWISQTRASFPRRCGLLHLHEYALTAQSGGGG